MVYLDLVGGLVGQGPIMVVLVAEEEVVALTVTNGPVAVVVILVVDVDIMLVLVMVNMAVVAVVIIMERLFQDLMVITRVMVLLP
jgi:hypothetical protein